MADPSPDSTPDSEPTQLDRAYSPGAFREMGHEVVDRVADYLQSALAGEGMPVFHGKSPQELERDWPGEITKEGHGMGAELIGNLLKYAHHLHHPGYVGHQVAAPLPAAGLAELTSSLLNNGMAVYDMGPANVICERRVVSYLCNSIGWPVGADGVLTHGGSVGNFTALLAARQSKAGSDVWDGGQDKGLAFLASAQNHYCVDRAVRMMGWGRGGLVDVEVDEEFRLRPDRLLAALQRAEADGRTVLAVVASACTTSTGSFDPIDPIADFCEEHGLWLHVDGAHGASFLVHPKQREKLAGIQRADSVVWDLHKMMLMPALLTAVLFKDGRRSYEAFAQEASYLFGGEDPEDQWYNLGQRTLECTKRGLGATAYFLLHTYGTGMFADYIGRMVRVTQEFAGLVRDSSDFELATWPQANIVCFRRKLAKGMNERVNALQERIRREIVARGDFYLVQTTLNGQVYLRMTIIHPFTELERLRVLLQELREA